MMTNNEAYAKLKAIAQKANSPYFTINYEICNHIPVIDPAATYIRTEETIIPKCTVYVSGWRFYSGTDWDEAFALLEFAMRSAPNVDPVSPFPEEGDPF